MRIAAAALVALVLVGCGTTESSTFGTVGEQLPAPRSAGASAPAGVDVDAICLATTYANCRDSLRFAIDAFAGSMVAVCEYPDATGDVVVIESENQAEAACSADGVISGSRVVEIVQLP